MKWDELTKGEAFIVMWQYQLLGDFKTALIHAIMVADESNLEKLRLGFPDEVESYLDYSRVDGWWRDLQSKIGKEED